MTQPRSMPWELLGECSDLTLDSFSLARQNLAANLRRSIEAEIVELAHAEADVEIVRLLRNCKKELAHIVNLRQMQIPFGETPELLIDESRETFRRRAGNARQRAPEHSFALREKRTA